MQAANAAYLRKLGADLYDLWLPETHSVMSLLKPGERIDGIVYGKYHQSLSNIEGRGALVATNKRVLLVDRKPLFSRDDDISYYAVSAVTYTSAGIAVAVVLHTRMGDIHVRTFNRKCAKNFVAAIEAQIF